MKEFLRNRTNRLLFIVGICLLVGLVLSPLFVSPDQEKIAPPSEQTISQTPIPPASKPKEYVPGQLMIRVKNGIAQNVLEQNLAQNNARIIDRIPEINILVLQVPTGTENQTVQNLIQSGVVEYAERDEIFHYNWVPNDPGLSQQYAIKKIQAEAAWDITKGSGIKVGLIDSGLQTNHPDLVGRIAATQNYSGEATLDDKIQHGTHTAGTITASTNNGVGIAGTCPECQIAFVKLGNNTSSSNIAKGITWTTDQGVKVINMSLGTPGACNQSVQTAINYAWGKGAVPVVSAGNESSNQPQSPASCTNVISVAATDANDKKASFSNYGNWVTVTAPGVNIYATFPGSTYKNLSGTSMSAPVTSAVVAMIWSTSYGTSPAAVKQRLCDTADKISGTGSNWQCGRVNLLNAVKSATTPSTAPSSAPSTAPSSAPPTVIVPTFGCMGSPSSICPTLPVSPNPSTGAPSGSTPPSTAPSQTPGNPTTPSPSVQPCEENNITYNRNRGKKHKKRSEGSISKFIQILLEFFIRLINLLLDKDGDNGGTNPLPPTDPC